MQADQIDFEEWRSLLRARAEAEHDGPTFQQLQQADERARRSRAELERYKASRVQGRSSGPPTAYAHEGEEVLPGIGGHSPADVAASLERGRRELEQRAAKDEREARGLHDRDRVCAARRARLQHYIDDFRTRASAAGVVVPDDDDHRLVPPTGLAGARNVRMAGSSDAPALTSPPPASSGGNAPPAARGTRSGMIARMLGI